MPHATPLIATIVAGLGLAFLFGLVANRLRVSPLVGYLLAGVAVGPFTPGFVADQALATELAEIGVILLMFGVGLHFSLKDLLSVRAIALPGALVQIACATVLGAGLAWLLGWSLPAGLTFGLALSVASTVVMLRMLQERRLVETERGRIAVGWLIVEDLAMVMALVMLPALATSLDGARDGSSTDIAVVLAATIGKIVAFVAVMLLVGRRVIPWLLHYVAHSGSRELFRLAVLAIALGVAFGAAKLFGVSFALGAFFAGMILSESELSHQAAEESLPLRDAFAVLFFVSVGMLVDPAGLVNEALPVLATLFIVVIGKSLAAFLIVVAFRYSVATALTVSASLAQIGEFSFILAELGLQLGLLPKQGRDLILAGAILSIILNPLCFKLVDWLGPRIEARVAARSAGAGAYRAPEPQAADAAHDESDLVPTALSGHTILVGYGQVGTLVAEALRARGDAFLVIENASARVELLRQAGIETIVGNAVTADVLAAANLAAARLVVLAVPDSFEAGQIVAELRAGNATVRIVARAGSDAEAEHLASLGADTVVTAKRELARGLAAVLAPSPV